ncbi:MAG TPA: hypothetical protein VFX16_37575 [Pseudonocardiaceae bacterium]|nr:hypothetical protein [Pseudonocardiaceae bacterium]
MAGEAEAIKAAGKVAVGVYKWARTTPVGKATTAAAVAGAAAMAEKAHGHVNAGLEHHAVEGVKEHIAKPVVENLTRFLRNRK